MTDIFFVVVCVPNRGKCRAVDDSHVLRPSHNFDENICIVSNTNKLFVFDIKHKKSIPVS